MKYNQELEYELIENQGELLRVTEKLDYNLERKRVEKTDLSSIFKLVESSLTTESEWSEFKASFEQLNPDFLSNLRQKHPNLTKSEIRLILLIKIGFTQKEIASILSIAPSSVKKAKSRARKKLDLSHSILLSDYLLSI